MGSSETTQRAQIPDELKPLINDSVATARGLQVGLPLGDFAQWGPRGVADLSPLQAYGLQNIPGLFNEERASQGAWNALEAVPELAARPVETPPAELGQLAQLWETTSGPIGSSPATRSGMEAWRQTVLPTVQNEMALMGLGRSGPALEEIARSQTGALTPLLQQEIENRMRSVPMLGDVASAQTARTLHPRDQTINALLQSIPMATTLGESMFSQRATAIEQALRGGQITREVAQQEFDAANEEKNRLQALSEAASLGPLGQALPSMIGTKQSSQKDLWSAIMGK